MATKTDELGDGFKEDCLDLIKAVVAHKSLDFQYFCSEWKRMGFHYVFIGHTFYYELVQYIENCFLALKKLFVSLNTTAERVACLYLMYAMYFKQPTKDFGKFRFTLTDWTTMKAFYDEINDECDEYLQARMIFWHLWQGNAFRFVECDLDIESIQNKMQFAAKSVSFAKINPVVHDAVTALRDESTGLISAIDILQAGYNEMKEHLSSSVAECSGLTNTTIAADIATHVKEIQVNFEDDFRRSERIRALQMRKQAARRSKRTATSMESDESSMTSESDTADSNYEDDNCVEVGASSDSDVECLNIGSKRIYLKRKAMDKSAKGLAHLQSVAASTSTRTAATTSDSDQSSPTKTSSTRRRKQARPQSTSKLMSPPLAGEQRLQKVKKKIEILEENGKLIVLNPSMKRLTTLKSSRVARQMICPPEVSTEIDGRVQRTLRRKPIKAEVTGK